MNRATRFTLLMVLVTSVPAWAWNDTGHRLVALIAWEQLPQTSRTEIVSTLRTHPRFATDFTLPTDITKADRTTQDRWLFAHAATWPDIARGLDGEERKTYHHGTWHWINVPFYLTDADHEELEPDLPTNLELTWDEDVHGAGRLNVVQSIARSRHILKQKSASSSEKALAICWLFHTVGDIHQPVHSTALFTSRRFRRGDAGGNGITIEGVEDLHAFWDDLATDVVTLADHDALIDRFTSDAGVVRQAVTGAQTTETVGWLDESHDLARDVVYNDLILDTVAANEAVYDTSKSWRDQPYLPEVALSDHYRRRAERVAIRRLVLAGHRLAVVLREVGF